MTCLYLTVFIPLSCFQTVCERVLLCTVALMKAFFQNSSTLLLFLNSCRFFFYVVTVFIFLSCHSSPPVVLLPATGLVMIGVIIGSRKVGINPDNVATPIAASLGDLITLSLLAGVSTTLYEYIGEYVR